MIDGTEDWFILPDAATVCCLCQGPHPQTLLLAPLVNADRNRDNLPGCDSTGERGVSTP
jgi:hypothetical protein